MKQLIHKLNEIDGKGYKAYKSVQGHYKYTHFDLYIDYVQGDPFAAPSKIRIVIPTQFRPLPPACFENRGRKIATEDKIARAVGNAVVKNQIVIKGSGKSGAIFFDKPYQEVLERSAVQLNPSAITVCMTVGFPANGRKINSREAIKLFEKVLPSIMQHSIFTITVEDIINAVQLADQQKAIRKEMEKQNWIAFIANGSILPRESGISNRPLKNAIPFCSPKENEVTIAIPHQSEPIKGMAIEKGITLIVGGGYHGKSTLLEAIQLGVYNHIKGDGREYVLTDPTAVKIRAEDGRRITNVNISPFINNLPNNQDTKSFSSNNASGSTSQAANVMEALEVGAKTLLIDEDTSATNFMIRDFRMQQLVNHSQEPITPFIDKITPLRDYLHVSTILVTGGSGDYFEVADTVIMMDKYVPYNVTHKVREIVRDYPINRCEKKGRTFGQITNRIFQQQTLQTKKGKRSKIQAKGLRNIVMGTHEISFEHTEQLIDPSQTRMIAEIIQFLDRTKKLGKLPLNKLLDEVEDQLDQKGLASFTSFWNEHPGELARPRRHEIAAVLNRIRTANVKPIYN